jgi:hypothetical protein
MFAIYMPWNNLGCLGIKITNRFYADIHRSPSWQLYWRINEYRYRINLRRFWHVYHDSSNPR